MSESKTKKRKRRAGRPTKPDAEKLVILGGKVSPETLANIAQIAKARNWTLSTAVRVACDLLIQQEAVIKSHTVNENLLTG
jgi:hypothetical protein